MEFKDLTNEQKEKVRAAKSSEELVAIAREEGVELTDEQLAAISGGGWLGGGGGGWSKNRK